ncbi:MAG: hypothetical protein Q7T01_04145 [bacterium]|nr:hypothetical protein [bacterium]
MLKRDEWGFLSLGVAIGALGLTFGLLYTPIGATVRTTGLSDASDDARVKPNVVLREVTEVPRGTRQASDDAGDGAAIVREAPSGESRRVVGAIPARLAAIAWPASLDARGIAATAPARVTAMELYGRIVPRDMQAAAGASAANAAVAFIAAGPVGVSANDPCVTVGAGERAALLDAYVRTQDNLPATVADYQFVCSLVTDPAAAIDVTKVFPDHRRIDLEPYAIRTFARFFGRLPAQNARGEKLPQEQVERDWWAVKYLTYFPVLSSARRDLAKERACVAAFTKASLDLYRGSTLVRKNVGEAPDDLWDWAFVRACAYSGAPFLDQFARR